MPTADRFDFPVSFWREVVSRNETRFGEGRLNKRFLIWVSDVSREVVKAGISSTSVSTVGVV